MPPFLFRRRRSFSFVSEQTLQNPQRLFCLYQSLMIRFKRYRLTHIGFFMRLGAASCADDLSIAGQLIQQLRIRYGTDFFFAACHDTHSLSLQSLQPDSREFSTFVVDPVQLILEPLQLFRRINGYAFIDLFVEPFDPL